MDMDRLDLVNLVPQWRSGKTRDGRHLPPEVVKGLTLAADDLEGVLRHRYTIGSEVVVKATGQNGEITGVFRETRRHPFMYVVALTGGEDFIGMRDELELRMPTVADPHELDPNSPLAGEETWRPGWLKALSRR